MKKILKRLATGFLAFATIVTALPTTTVHASEKQYWTESAERVGIVEKVMNDGSIGSTFNEGHMTVEGEDAFCVDINTNFRNGYKTRADASTRMSYDQISDVALSIEYVNQYVQSHSGLSSQHIYLLKQCVVWQRLSVHLGWQCDNVRASYDEIPKAIQDEVYAGAKAFASENKGRYECGGYIYSGEGQDIGQFWAKLAVGNATLKKTSSNASITDGNGLYSIAGATYGVYSDKDCTKQLATLTTDNSGNTDTVEVKAGTVYIKELSAPAGYKVDNTVYSLNVEAGKTATLNVSDTPKVTDTLIELFKIDMETQKDAPQGDASLEGAEFTWKFYAGHYTADNLPSEPMYKLSYVIRVSAPDLDELKRRCDEVKDFYDDLNVKLVRPAGDMLGLHSEFLPASKRYINDYVQYVKSDFLAGLGFGATQQLGENTGIYIGYSVDTGRNVYLQPSLASQGVKGTVTNALASAFVGSLGGGKSFCNNLIVYYSVLFGGQAVILDPKSERGNWKETLPEIAHEINIVNLTSDKENAGLLDPFVIMKNVKDAESLAIDILTFLTGISSRDGEKFPVLRKAVRAVTQSDQRGLLHVIDELRREDTAIARNIADHIDSFTDYDFAHLLFSDGSVSNAISLDNQLNIIQVADLVLPDKDTTFEEYTTIELLSVAMLIVISTFALDFIHSDRSIFKIVDLDEAWAFLNVAQGETLSNKLVRAGRAMQAGVYFVTQSSGDVSKESLKNNIGLKFAFRSTDINEIKQTLEFFGIDKDDENNQKRLRDLENGQCLLQDLYGRVGVVQIHPVFEELLHAFDTRPPVKSEVE